jgi:ABC-type taurine transport system ATPase subunit
MGTAQVNDIELSLSTPLAWVAALALLLSFGTSIWNIVGSSARNNGRRIDEAGKRIDGHETRLSSVEQTLRAMPGKDDLHVVALALSDIRGDLKAMSAEMQATNKIMARLEHSVVRHDEHLSGGGSKR